jgi:tetratricopeptide (TPR) repeat protein
VSEKLARHKFFTLSNAFYKIALIFATPSNKYLHQAEGYINQGRYKDAALIYKKAISLQPTLSTVYYFGSNLAKKGNLNDEFYTSILDVIETPEIRLMIDYLSKSPAIFQPSKMWLYFMIFNTFQIEAGGIENFKRTVNHNYFNWTGDSDVMAQFDALKNKLNWSDSDIVNAETFVNFETAKKPIEFTEEKWKSYVQYLCMLWEFAVKNDRLELLKHLEEPLLGNPLAIQYKGRKVTQDICNSVIDVNTIMEFISYNSCPNSHLADYQRTNQSLAAKRFIHLLFAEIFATSEHR